MQRRAVTTLLLGVVPLAISLSACEGGDRKRLLEDSQIINDKLDQIDKKIDAYRLHPDNKVIILVKKVGTNIVLDSVKPPQKDVCKPAGTDCAEKVRFLLAGPIGNWKVHGEEKKGEAQTNCFKPFDLDSGNRTNEQEPVAACQVTGMTWEYDVVLLDSDGKERGRIDPILVMNWSP